MGVLLLLVVIVAVVAGIVLWVRRAPPETHAGFARTESDNSADAMYEQGMAFRRGDDLELDFDAARRLFRRAAEMNHAQAQFEYGVMLDRGLGGDQDPVKGVRWIEHAAKNGCNDARLFIGKRYLAGEGVPRNPERAELYLRGAADAGLAEAQAVLGGLYLDAEAPLADPVKAAAWLGKAVSQRYPAAFFSLSELYERGVGVTKDIKKADELLLQAADFGDPKAQLKIAKYYLTGAFGHAFPQNFRTALDWFKRASAHGVAEAEYEVGLRYERNEGVDKPDMAHAVASYLKAAEMGYAPAQNRIGQVYLYGQGVNQNLREARRWFAAAAAQGHVEAAKQSLKLQSAVSDDVVIGHVDGAAQSDNTTDWKG